MPKDYAYVIRQLDALKTTQEKIRFILNYLATHNKNLTKTQDWLIDDLLEFTKKIERF